MLLLSGVLLGTLPTASNGLRTWEIRLAKNRRTPIRPQTVLISSPVEDWPPQRDRAAG
jgi:hypothetical protein